MLYPSLLIARGPHDAPPPAVNVSKYANIISRFSDFFHTLSELSPARNPKKKSGIFRHFCCEALPSAPETRGFPNLYTR